MEDLLDYFQLLLEYAQTRGSNLNRASQQALAQLINQFEQIIQEMNQPSAAPPSSLPPSEIPSSNVAGMDYDDNSKSLLVQFLGKFPNRNGPIYQYSGVPKVIAELLQSGAIPARTEGKNKWGNWWKGKVPSLGASVFTLIGQNRYPYQRVG